MSSNQKFVEQTADSCAWQPWAVCCSGWQRERPGRGLLYRILVCDEFVCSGQYASEGKPEPSFPHAVRGVA